MTSRDIPALLSIAAFLGLLVLFGFVFWNQPALTPAPPAAPDTRDGHDGIIGREGRVPLAVFRLPGASDQAAVRRSLAATQTLSCDSSASLIYRNDVIIFAAHEILTSDGSYRPDLASCQFKVVREVDGRPRTELYPILLDTLDNGPLVQQGADADEAWNIGNMQDWVIARLARPVVGLRPYELPDTIESAGLGQPGGDLVTISEATSNWRGKEDEFIAQTCKVVWLPKGFAEAYPGVLHFDCDTGPGASGSAVLQRVGGDDFRYLATMIAYSGRQCDEVGLYSCFAIGRRVDDDLAARIRGTTAIRATPEDEALARAQAARLEARRARVTEAIVTALAAPFPGKDDTKGDAKGRAVATLYARIAELVAGGRANETEPLFLEAFKTLDDPDRQRREWPMLLRLNAESLLAQGRKADAFAAFDGLEDETTPGALRAYLELRLGQTSADAAQARVHLLTAHMLGGDALFRHFGAQKELDTVKAPGFAQALAASETPAEP